MPSTGVIVGAAVTTSPTTNQIVIDMDENIRMLDPDVSQFTTMLMKMPQQKAESYRVEWLDDRLMPRVATLGAAAGSGSVSFTFSASDGLYFRAGDICRIVSTGEAFEVSGTPTSTSVTAGTRGLGSVAAASAASGTDVVIVGNSSVEGGTLPTILMTKTVQNYNYTQIQRHSYGFARTLIQTNTYGGNILDRERKKKAVEHKRAIEQTLFFGPRYYTSTGPEHTCGGLVEFVTTNVSSAGGTFDKAELQTFLETGMQHGSDQKVLFAAPRVVSVMAAFLQDNWIRAGTDETVWGARVNGIISSAFGGAEIPVFVKRPWGDFSKGTSNDYGSRAFLVDLAYVQYAPLQSTVQLRNREAPDYDGSKEEYLTEHSFRVENESVHQIWTNISA